VCGLDVISSCDFFLKRVEGVAGENGDTDESEPKTRTTEERVKLCASVCVRRFNLAATLRVKRPRALFLRERSRNGEEK
jgi:hypothetical protein